MFPLIAAALAALAVSMTTGFQGQYYPLKDDAEGYLALDAADVERTGDIIQARILGVFPEAHPWKGKDVWLTTLLIEVDCTTDKARTLGGVNYTRDFEMVDDLRETSEWRNAGPRGYIHAVADRLCRGTGGPAAESQDFKLLAQAYWRRTRGLGGR